MKKSKKKTTRKPRFKKDVHTEHCCVIHGCKYGNDKCTVTTRKKPQSFCCEDCGGDGIESLKTIKAILEGRQPRCPYCRHCLP